jgi:hypothetical protein
MKHCVIEQRLPWRLTSDSTLERSVQKVSDRESAGVRMEYMRGQPPFLGPSSLSLVIHSCDFVVAEACHIQYKLYQASQAFSILCLGEHDVTDGSNIRLTPSAIDVDPFGDRTIIPSRLIPIATHPLLP